MSINSPLVVWYWCWCTIWINVDNVESKLKSPVASSYPRRIHRRRRYLYVDDIFFFCVGVLRSDHDLKCVMNACCSGNPRQRCQECCCFSLTCIASANLIGSITWNDKRALMYIFIVNETCRIITQITYHTYDKIYPNKINVLEKRYSHDANLLCYI